jgi:O-antigen/teichoic acid export membrane protein
MENLDDVKKKSIAGVVSYSLRTGMVYVIALIATLLLGVYLDPGEFGIYYIVLSVIGIFTFLSDVGLAAALVQSKTDPSKEDLATTFTVQQMLAVGIFLLILIMTPVWQKYTRLDQHGLWLLYALGFSFVLASLKTIPSIILERQLQFNKLVIPQVIEQLLFYSIAVIMAMKGFGVSSFTVAVLVRSIAGVVSIYFLQPWKISIGISKQSLNRLLKFGFKFQANDLLARLKDDLFIVVLAKFIGPVQMGYLGWAKRWSMFPYQFSVSNVVAITFPTYSRLQEHKEVLARALEKSIYFISLVIFPVLMGMSVMARPLTELIPDYQKWQPALPLLYFFCLNIAFAAVANPMINTLNAMGDINKTLKLMIVMTAATWFLSPMGYYLWGINGIAIVSAIVAGLSLFSYLPISKILAISLFRQIRSQLAASILMGLLIWQIQQLIPVNLFTFIFLCAVGGISYLLFMMVADFNRLKMELKSLIT